MKYDIVFMLNARMNITVEADSIDEAEQKLLKKDVLEIVANGRVEESDCDIIATVKTPRLRF